MKDIYRFIAAAMLMGPIKNEAGDREKIRALLLPYYQIYAEKAAVSDGF